MHKRTTPKIFGRAKELHRNLSPAEAKLWQHLEQQESDEERTNYLEERGHRVLRFWNNDVMNHKESVLQVIWNSLNDKG